MIPLLSFPPHFFTKKTSQKSLLETELTDLRHRMVREQIQARGITDQRVLKALWNVPRHHFIPSNLQAFAYVDHPLSIGYGQTISQPYIVAYMTEKAQILPTDKILEIGTGCGYQTAILAELSQAIYSVEIIPQLTEKARQNLQKLGYQNISLKTGDGYEGWQEYAPFDVILVTAAPPYIPKTLVEQLAPNGRLIIPVGNIQQYIEIVHKTAAGILKQRTLQVQFVPLIHQH